MYELHEPPAPQHGDRFYFHVEEVKPKKRRKKTDPRMFKVTQIPWDDFNHSELIRLCYYNLEKDIRSGAELCRSMSRGIPREDLISLLLTQGKLEDLPTSPVHKSRDAIITWLEENWDYAYSQIECGLTCWECTDACVMACYLVNANLYKERVP